MDAEETGGGVLAKDLLWLMVSFFLVVIVLLLPHINPVAKKAAEESETPPGLVSVEIRWPDESKADVDLWVQAPGDVPVGYSNKGGRIFNLLRDDLGRQADFLGINYENSYTRGAPAGEYTVNVHAYRGDGTWPVPVTVQVGIRDAHGLTQVLNAKVELLRDGQETTVVRFKLNAKGVLVPGSVTNLQRGLRALRKQ